MESSPFGNTDILTGGLPLGLVVETSELSSTVSLDVHVVCILFS